MAAQGGFMAIKHILLDLDDTIFDFHRSERESISKTLKAFGVEPTDFTVRRYSEINRECWQALERKEMTREEVLVKRFERLFSELSVEANAEDVKAVYEELLSGCHHMIPGAMELIRELRSGYTVSLASNGTARVQDKRIAASGIGPLFDNIFISEKLLADKPSPKFFDACMKALGEPDKEQVIIVGDSLSSDITGGLGYGIYTLWYNPAGKEAPADIRPHFSARKLSEIPEIIKTIK